MTKDTNTKAKEDNILSMFGFISMSSLNSTSRVLFKMKSKYLYRNNKLIIIKNEVLVEKKRFWENMAFGVKANNNK